VLLGARRGGNRWVPVVIGALLLAAVVAILLVATSGGGSSHTAAATRSTNAPAVTGTKTAFSPASVTVAVLNGTNVSQLAHRVEQKLKQAGYKGGTVATASDQTHTASVVGYLPGHQRAATHVASSLGLGSGAVQQLDQSARAVACPPPSACSATVVVTVGSDLSSTR
jgi:phosphoenolpyruvate-protein kinase (PTS system EI component)